MSGQHRILNWKRNPNSQHDLKYKIKIKRMRTRFEKKITNHNYGFWQKGLKQQLEIKKQRSKLKYRYIRGQLLNFELKFWMVSTNFEKREKREKKNKSH
jgi:hypothetical protein